MTNQITPVTDTLSRSMSQTFATLKGLELSAGRRKLNDASDYTEIVNQLEELTIATLAATSSQPLLGMRPTGARFDISAGTELAHAVSRSVSYLRDTASEVLRSGNLSKYESKNTDTALDRMKSLYGLLVNGIMRQAKVDLDAIRDRQGPTVLAAMADQLAEAARRVPPTVGD